VNISKISFDLRDNGGRRSGIERRFFSYFGHLPERRSEDDRRSILDRRSGLDRRNGNSQVIDLEERRVIRDRRKAWNEMILQFSTI
jgi:hypothetical protein